MRWNHLTRKKTYIFTMVNFEVVVAVMHDMYDDGTLKVCEPNNDGKATYLHPAYIVLVRDTP